jgi:hypothetical protein
MMFESPARTSQAADFVAPSLVEVDPARVPRGDFGQLALMLLRHVDVEHRLV